jgi:hypothetical protein
MLLLMKARHIGQHWLVADERGTFQTVQEVQSM